MLAKDHSFDIVSEVDLQEVTNAIDQTKKEVSQRYDFKGSSSEVDWNLKDKKITLHTENEIRLKSLVDILQTKLAKRQVSLKSLDFESVEKATGGSARQGIKIVQGIPQEKAKEIVKFIKNLKVKAQPQIQSDQVRVQAAKIDLLQEVIQQVRQHDFGVELQFINYR